MPFINLRLGFKERLPVLINPVLPLLVGLEALFFFLILAPVKEALAGSIERAEWTAITLLSQ